MEHDNKTLKDLRDRAEKEIANLLATKPTLSSVEVSNAKEAVCLIKEIDEVLEGKGEYETSEGMRRTRYPNMEYSYGPGRAMYYPNMEYAYGPDTMSGRAIHYPGMTYSYDGRMDYSGARGRDAATGRYVSRGDRAMHDMTYSGHSIEDRAIQKLEEMMDTAKSDYERQRINQFIRVIESMIGE